MKDSCPGRTWEHRVQELGTSTGRWVIKAWCGEGNSKAEMRNKMQGTKKPQVSVGAQDEGRDIQQLWVWVFSLLEKEKAAAKRGGRAGRTGQVAVSQPGWGVPAQPCTLIHVGRHPQSTQQPPTGSQGGKRETSSTTHSPSSRNPPGKNLELPKSESATDAQGEWMGFVGFSTGCETFPWGGTGSQWQSWPSITLGAATLGWKIICFHTHTQNSAALFKVRTQVQTGKELMAIETPLTPS